MTKEPKYGLEVYSTELSSMVGQYLDVVLVVTCKNHHEFLTVHMRLLFIFLITTA
ncbi:hypothetical protein ACWATR_16190 [Nostoc sp. UIC 10890]